MKQGEAIQHRARRNNASKEFEEFCHRIEPIMFAVLLGGILFAAAIAFLGFILLLIAAAMPLIAIGNI